MMDRTREFLDRLVAWSPVLLLGALAALTYWLDAQVQAPPARRDGSTRHDPDLFLQDFKAITFDAQGNPRETLSAARAEHFPDDESAELTKPKLSLADAGRPTITITADRGRIDGDRNQGDFAGDVRVVRDADPAAVSAARALGMTDAQILRDVRLPLAAPIIMAGVRTAAVIDVGTATLAAFIGAGGLGEPIVAGLALSDTRMILSGAIPAALLAVAVDAGLAVVERWTRPG